VVLAVLQGLGLMAIVLVLYMGLLQQGTSQALASTLAFGALVFGNLGLILSSRSKIHSLVYLIKTPNPSQKWIAGIAVGGFSLLLAVPFLRERFRFELFTAQEGLLLLVTLLIALMWFELTKKWMATHVLESEVSL
jgi:P-type Ca2+ transporter type 2C